MALVCKPKSRSKEQRIGISFIHDVRESTVLLPCLALHQPSFSLSAVSLFISLLQPSLITPHGISDNINHRSTSTYPQGFTILAQYGQPSTRNVEIEPFREEICRR